MPINDPSRIMNAATATGAGPTFNMYEAYKTFTFSKTIAGVFSALVVNFEGSINGTDWFLLGSDNTTSAGATQVVDKPCRYVRANIGTFTGGTSVTVDFLPTK